MTETTTQFKSWADPHTGECPVAQTLHILGGKHGPSVLHCLTTGEMHFLELARAIDGISRKVLTDQLKDFEAHGLILRSPKNDARQRVGYLLTAKGRSLCGILGQLYDWNKSYR